MITVKPNTESPSSYKEAMEKKINKYLESEGRVEFAIRSSAYHNNGSKIYPIEVCREIAKEMKRLGYYCYWTRPSWKYDQMMDFVISKRPMSSSQGNISEV